MMERRKQGASVRQWIEEERERLSERAYALAEDCAFYGAFYAQCVESTDRKSTRLNSSHIH